MTALRPLAKFRVRKVLKLVVSLRLDDMLLPEMLAGVLLLEYPCACPKTRFSKWLKYP